MSLHGLRKSKEPGLQRPLDVRTLGAVPENEHIPYPISPEIEMSYTEEDWMRWVFLLRTQLMAEKRGDPVIPIEETFHLLFCLKIINAERSAALLAPWTRELMKALITRQDFLSEKLGLLSKYCYAFSETPTQVFPGENISKKSVYEELALILSMDEDYIGEKNKYLFAELMHAYMLFPEYFPREELAEYWPSLFQTFKEKKYEDQLMAAAYLRILYPEHLADLGLQEGPRPVSNQNDYAEIAYLKILARPEIPGLTTWPPKKTGEPQFADNIPGQPEALKL